MLTPWGSKATWNHNISTSVLFHSWYEAVFDLPAVTVAKQLYLWLVCADYILPKGLVLSYIFTGKLFFWTAKFFFSLSSFIAQIFSSLSDCRQIHFDSNGCWLYDEFLGGAGGSWRLPFALNGLLLSWICWAGLDARGFNKIGSTCHSLRKVFIIGTWYETTDSNFVDVRLW